MVSSTLIAGLSPDANLICYLRRIGKYLMLGAPEELALVRQWHADRNTMVLERVVTSPLRLLAKIAKDYRGYGLPLGDLIAKGNSGMMRAVHRFDPDRQLRLATYAMWWIREAIQEQILPPWLLVKMGATASQKNFFSISRG